MMKDNFKQWLKAAGIRAIKTFFQAFGAGIIVGAGFKDINWPALLSVAAVAAVASICTSLAGLPEVDTEEKEND
jgi:hypothetical protein